MKIGKFFGNIGGWMKDHSSDLKMGIGTAGVIGGTMVLCREAVQAHEILEEYRENKQTLIDADADKKELRSLKAKTAGKVVLKMLPGTVLEGAGLGSMWSGYSKVKTALISVGAAYTGLQEFIDNYRAGVREKYGEEVDEELAYRFREEEIVVTDENGQERTETVKIYPHNASKMPSPYARYFCYGEAEGAEKSLDYNLRFLRLQQNTANSYYRAHKKFMLNDMNDMLGYKRSIKGNRVGWIYDPDNPEGDNRIDFRARIVYREKIDENGNPDGFEKVILIDPNVDGMVEEKMVRLGLMDP